MPKKNISTNILANKTQAEVSSVIDMLNKTAVKQLVTYKEHQGVQLTKQKKSYFKSCKKA